jgi:hypothetical protein
MAIIQIRYTLLLHKRLGAAWRGWLVSAKAQAGLRLSSWRLMLQVNYIVGLGNVCTSNALSITCRSGKFI